MMEFKSVLVYLCVVPFLVQGLDNGDPNTCKKEQFEVETMKTTYFCTKSKAKRVCTKTSKRIVPKISYICCNGSKFIDDKCVFVCDPPCHNAECTKNNVCTCNSGLQRLNDTICGPRCPPDQYNDFSDPAFLCKSKCSQPCINGICIDFDECSCNPGYKKKDKFSCEPKCGTCIYGTCDAPEYECKCLSGYKKNSDDKCEPICDECEHGSCIAPNDCKCDVGYRKEDNKCIPVCNETCQNGQCTAPNECTCAPQHSKDVTDMFKCHPICSQKCENSACVAPDVCRCNDGFETAGNNWTCRPSCSSCDNGICQAPNDCICNDGYIKNEVGICVPYCESCKDGICVAPNDCACNDGYKKNKNDICTPYCNSCKNGVCIAPNECLCNEGYKKNNESLCVPDCKSCDNGVCLTPSNCMCKDGYGKNDKGICVPICKIPCIDGVCTKPDTCVCNPGYKMDAISNKCKHTCSPSCVNSTCTAVNVCNCLFGYTETNVSHICKPAEVHHCHDGLELVNGTCMLPPSINCKECEGACEEGVCKCSNGSLCYQIESADVESTPTLAGLQLTWMLGGAVGILLVVIVAAILVRMWRHRQNYDEKTPNDDNAYGSVVYTVPNTLMHRGPQDPDYDDVELNGQPSDGLLDHIPTENYVERI